jgi:hypothetical protein
MSEPVLQFARDTLTRAALFGTQFATVETRGSIRPVASTTRGPKTVRFGSEHGARIDGTATIQSTGQIRDTQRVRCRLNPGRHLQSSPAPWGHSREVVYRGPDMINPVIQLDDFRKAIRLLGGGRATADALGVSDRHIRHVLAGKRELHAGILADLDDALARRANDCRDLRRRLSPVFERNLTPEQRERPIHGNSAHARRAAGEGRHG